MNKIFLYRMIDDARAFYLVHAVDEKEADQKLAEYCDLDELDTTVSDVAVLEDDVEEIE
jgi:hypothetical protein